ncbi:MAG: DedA family protein [Alphaproteobacteria bacterium]|nr:DedA family protein [Alphaproteobacteria bacterium]
MESYLAAFFSAFLASTLLPLSSEGVLAALALHRGGDWVVLWFFASLGNTAGALVNYLIGRYLLLFQDQRWFPVGREALARAQGWFARFGTWSLLFSWLPVVGDPLTLVAGVMRTQPALFLVLVFAGKAARYAAVLALAGAAT